MAKKQDKNDPSNTSSNYNTMTGRWYMISSLMGGTESMREAGEILLPRHAREGDQNYNERLNKAVLFNLFELTLNLLADKPFTEQITLGDQVPASLQEYAKDIDLRGNNLNGFGYEVFRQGLSKAFTHVLVDAPETEVEEGEVRTLADDRREGMRPYFVHIHPEALIAAETTRINGEEIYTHIRFYETEVTRDGFLEVVREYIRVMDLVEDEDGSLAVQSVRWRKAEKGEKKAKEGDWIEDGPPKIIDIDRIPLKTFYTDRDGVLLGKPPMLDLAYMNTEHWQSYSDQQNILTVSRFPLLAGSGISEYDGADTVVGPRNMLIAEDPAARYYYVEHSGSAIEVGFKSLADLETKMASYGGSLLQKRPDRETAKARDATEQNVTAPLQRMVQGFRNFMAELFVLMAKMDGEEITVDTETLAGDINIKDDFGEDAATAVDLQTLQVAVREGAISRRGFLTQLKRLKLVGEDFDVDEEMQNIRNEIDLMAIIAAATKGMSGVQDPPDPDAQEDDNDEPPETDPPADNGRTSQEG